MCVCVFAGEGAVNQSIPIVLTQQELAALVQQQQQLQDIHNQQEHSTVPTGTTTEPEPRFQMFQN